MRDVLHSLSWPPRIPPPTPTAEKVTFRGDTRLEDESADVAEGEAAARRGEMQKKTHTHT